jgi:3-oxoacyl-(acyl-carrier-protein) synthase
MRRAIGDAGIQPEDLGFIVAHGTATRLNDVTEAAAIREALGPQATGEVPVVAYKPFFGHTMGACGVVEFIVGLLSVTRGALHGTPNLIAPDPACGVRHAPRRLPTPPGTTFMCNSFGFGGSNAVLIGRGAPGGRRVAPAREETHARSH